MTMHRRQLVSLLVAICCLAFVPRLPAQEKPADLIVVNGKVVTVDGRFSIAQAVAIRDGLFLAVGTNDEVRKLAGAGTKTIDAKGRTVVPGLIETHVHATGASRGEAEQPFVQLASIDEIKDWVRKRVASAQPGEWVRLPRVDVTRIRERRLPTRKDLDEAAPNHPAAFVWQYASRQVQVLNTAAIKAAGITRDTKAPPRGKIHFDENGEPTGVMEECGPLTAEFLRRKPLSEEKYLASLEKLLRTYNEVGITSIFERNSSADGFRDYQKLKAQDRLPVRVTVTIGLGRNVQDPEKAIRALTVKPAEGDDWVRVGPLKIGVDGGVLYGTAYLREPYGSQAFALYGFSDPNYRGDLGMTPEKIKEIIRAGHRLGWQMSSHVTGDAGVDIVLDGVEAANDDSPIKDRRYTLIHAYFANDETAKRAARLGVCVDTQPAWFYKDGDALTDAIGSKRMEKFLGLKVWRDAGVKVALNSDHMQGFGPQTALNPYDPFLTMYTAVSRKTDSGLLIGPGQRVSREEALRMTTIDAAWLSFDEKKKGSIEPGKLADLAILTDDYLTCPEENIKKIRSAVTIAGGKVVYEADK
jgi:predicted amidohydrolase YtcJ